MQLGNEPANHLTRGSVKKKFNFLKGGGSSDKHIYMAGNIHEWIFMSRSISDA
jgi:hypothetical protein